jgi:hypothetical protein
VGKQKPSHHAGRFHGPHYLALNKDQWGQTGIGIAKAVVADCDYHSRHAYRDML